MFGFNVNMADQLVNGPPAKRPKIGSPSLTPTDTGGMWLQIFIKINFTLLFFIVLSLGHNKQDLIV